MPKLAEPLRTVLIETVQRQTNELRKTFNPDGKGLDKYGLTKAQRDFVGQLYGQYNPSGLAALVSISGGKAGDATGWDYNKLLALCATYYSERASASIPSVLPLVAVYIEKAAIGLNDVPALVTHNEKATILSANGTADKSSLVASDKFRLCTDAEVVDLIDNFTEQQIATVITHRYFEGVRLDALMKHDEDADDSGDGDVKKPKPTPVSV